MKFSNRIFLYGPTALLLLLAVAAGLWWWHAADRLSVLLDAANGHDIVPGVRVSFSSASVGGFPFRLETRIENLKVETRDADGPLVWTSEHLAAHALTYGRAETIFEAAGKQSLQWRDGEHRGHGLPFAVGTMRASAILDGGALARFDLDIQGFGSPALVAARLQFHVRRDPDADALDVWLGASNVHLSQALRSPLGDRLSTIAIGGRFLPAAPLRPLLQGGKDWRAALADWRVHQGRLAVDDLTLDWSKTKLSGHGELALDSQSRPIGVLNLDLSGYDRLLQARGPHQRGIGNALLAFAAQQGAHNGSLAARLAFKDGIAYVGTAPAAFVPPLY